MIAPLRISPLGFAGGLHDRDTGLVRFGWRDYDPDTGRFTAKDPIGAAGGDSDWYGYCLDDPINGRDPEGLDTRKYGGADSEAGKKYDISLIEYDNQQQQLDILDEYMMPRKRIIATSGIPGESDPSVKNKGPIPPGEYFLKPEEISEAGWARRHLDARDWGEYRVPLHPSGVTNTYGRTGFYMHGGVKPGSTGCIDVGSEDITLFPHLQQQQRCINVKVK